MLDEVVQTRSANILAVQVYNEFFDHFVPSRFSNERRKKFVLVEPSSGKIKAKTSH